MRPVAVLNAETVEGSFGGYILSFVDFLDSNLGASEWGTREIAVTTALILGIIRLLFGDAYGVNWYSFVHGVVSGYLSLMAVWLSVFAALPLTGVSEPLRSITCQGPLTSLHRIAPAITMGYGLFDILDGITHGIDFVRFDQSRTILGNTPKLVLTLLTPISGIAVAPWIGNIHSDGILLRI